MYCIQALIGPPQAECHQTQHYHMYRGPHLVLETSQMMPNIPFGDDFTVEARGDVKAVEHDSSRCHITTHVSVPFSKSTWWRKVSLSNVIVADWIGLLVLLHSRDVMNKTSFTRSSVSDVIS